jgi:hypothetical protein
VTPQRPRWTRPWKKERQTPFQAFVPDQQAHVFGTFAANGLEQCNRFNELGLGEPALPLPQIEIGLDEFGQAK